MAINAILKGIIKNTDSLYTRMEEITYEVIEPLIESGLSRAEAVAETVLGLLRIGEGKYVTNELLSSADKSYLVDNYDLPLDEISTLARAKEQGFDLDNPMYRGRRKSGGSTNTLRSTKVYTTDNPMTAASYSSQIDNTGEDFYNPIFLEKLKESGIEKAESRLAFANLNEENLVKTNIIDKYVMRPSIDEVGEVIDPIVIDARGKRWSDVPSDAEVSIGDQKITLEELFKELPERAMPQKNKPLNTDYIGQILQKYGGELGLPRTVIYKNLEDLGNFQVNLDGYIGSPKGINNYLEAKTPSTVRMDLDKSIIRKAYDPTDKITERPRFDPRLGNLKNLLASAAPVAVSLGALSELKEEPQ